jgi:hypothetical protein
MRGDVAPDHPLRATRDLYIPKSKRRDTDEPIIVMACFTCNQMKGDRFPEQWDRFMQRNPRWWEVGAGKRSAKVKQTPPAPVVLPMAHSLYILQHGKRAYRSWVERGCPEPGRPLRPGEPIPIQFEDPGQQAAFEAYAKKYRHVLRVPDEGHPR